MLDTRAYAQIYYAVWSYLFDMIVLRLSLIFSLLALVKFFWIWIKSCAKSNNFGNVYIFSRKLQTFLNYSITIPDVLALTKQFRLFPRHCARAYAISMSHNPIRRFPRDIRSLIPTARFPPLHRPKTCSSVQKISSAASTRQERSVTRSR